MVRTVGDCDSSVQDRRGVPVVSDQRSVMRKKTIGQLLGDDSAIIVDDLVRQDPGLNRAAGELQVCRISSGDVGSWSSVEIEPLISLARHVGDAALERTIVTGPA